MIIFEKISQNHSINLILYLCNRNRLCVIIEMLKSQIYVT